MCLHDEVVDDTVPFEIFDPDFTWKRKTMTDYTLRQLKVPIFRNGELVYRFPSLSEVRDHCKRELDTMWDEVLRFENPHKYYVDLSERLWSLKREMIANRGRTEQN